MARLPLPRGMANILDSKGRTTEGELPSVPLGGTRQQALHRLQIGIGGVLGILMLVGLASLIQDQADQAEKDSVPEAAPTNVPTAAPTKADPLVEAGVVPDLPATPTPTATAAAEPILPERGEETPPVE